MWVPMGGFSFEWLNCIQVSVVKEKGNIRAWEEGIGLEEAGALKACVLPVPVGKLISSVKETEMRWRQARRGAV